MDNILTNVFICISVARAAKVFSSVQFERIYRMHVVKKNRVLLTNDNEIVVNIVDIKNVWQWE